MSDRCDSGVAYSGPAPMRAIMVVLMVAVFCAAAIVLALYNPHTSAPRPVERNTGVSYVIPAHAENLTPRAMPNADKFAGQDLSNAAYSIAWQRCGKYLPRVLTSATKYGWMVSVSCSTERKGNSTK